jgi:hypothetical protein
MSWRTRIDEHVAGLPVDLPALSPAEFSALTSDIVRDLGVPQDERVHVHYALCIQRADQAEDNLTLLDDDTMRRWRERIHAGEVFAPMEMRKALLSWQQERHWRRKAKLLETEMERLRGELAAAHAELVCEGKR